MMPLLSAVLQFMPLAAPRVLYVAPNGSDSNSGGSPADALASCAGALAALQRETSPLPAGGGVEVRFAPGTFAYNDSTACGIVALRASEQRPVVFRGAGAGTTIMDGAERLDASGLRPVSNASVLSVLNPAAKGKVLAMPVRGASARTALEVGSQLQWDGIPLTPSVFPNSGQAFVRRVWDRGHQGSTSNFSMSNPIGANLSIAAPRPTGNWQRELAAGFPGGSITGYLSVADWYRETHRVARVSQTADATTLKLLEWSRYEICEALEGGCTNAPGRFTAHGWLSEVDSPGEVRTTACKRLLLLSCVVTPICPAAFAVVVRQRCVRPVRFPAGRSGRIRGGERAAERAAWRVERGQLHSAGQCVVGHGAQHDDPGRGAERRGRRGEHRGGRQQHHRRLHHQERGHDGGLRRRGLPAQRNWQRHVRRRSSHQQRRAGGEHTGDVSLSASLR